MAVKVMNSRFVHLSKFAVSLQESASKYAIKIQAMKKIALNVLHIIVLCSFSIGCNNEIETNSSDWNFDSIQYSTELYLIHSDDRFGEWGGNTFFIRVYRDYQTNQILLDYKEYEGMMGPPPPPHPDSIPNTILEWYETMPVLFEKIRIKASESYLKLIADAIQELIDVKVNNSEFVTMSGKENKVIYSDSTLIIEDYPSTNWDKFQLIRKKLESE
jgi:hypothetical protein